MKKLSISLVCLALACATLSGCGRHEKLSERTHGTDDMGAISLSNGYALHGYRLLNGVADHDHFVYFLEKDGKPVAGTSTNYNVNQGKSSTNESISSEIAFSVAPSVDTCATEAECEQKIAAFSPTDARLRQLQLEYQKIQLTAAARQ